LSRARQRAAQNEREAEDEFGFHVGLVTWTHFSPKIDNSFPLQPE
jgi:hypothetical protein